MSIERGAGDVPRDLRVQIQRPMSRRTDCRVSARLPYFIVEDLDRSLAAVKERGGEVIDGPREMVEGRACFVRDPAGACSALYQVS